MEICSVGTVYTMRASLQCIICITNSHFFLLHIFLVDVVVSGSRSAVHAAFIYKVLLRLRARSHSSKFSISRKLRNIQLYSLTNTHTHAMISNAVSLDQICECRRSSSFFTYFSTHFILALFAGFVCACNLCILVDKTKVGSSLFVLAKKCAAIYYVSIRMLLCVCN